MTKFQTAFHESLFHSNHRRGVIRYDIVEAFLALLDYVSRADEIDIHPSSVRPSFVSQSYLNIMHGFLSNLVAASPKPYARTS